MRDAAISQRRAAGAIGDDQCMFWSGDLFVVHRERLHELQGVDALLVTHPSEIVKGQSGQRYDRSAVERRVVKSVHQMDCARTGRADTNPELTGVFGEPACHEGRGFFVADADIGDPVPLPP